VVDNRVYFTISVNVTPGTDGAAPIVTYTSTPATVPVGFVMSVTPQIGESGMVSMNVRPTISRIIGYVNDPSPALAAQNVISRLPEIQTREIESLLRVSSGDIAVLGGLMQDSVSNQTDGVPGAQEIPGLGALFRYRNDKTVKSELVILIRPVIVNDASLDGDYKPYRVYAPDADFFRQRDEVGAGRRIFNGSAGVLNGGRP
jgi:general secretion pathway protein D